MNERLADIVAKPWVLAHAGYRTLCDARLFPPESALLKNLPHRWVVIDFTWRFDPAVKDYAVHSFETLAEAEAFLNVTMTKRHRLPEFVNALYRNRRYR